ncbi:HipA N-terminal domain-containing protein [Arsenophonus nasoniae]|nr:conserved hypothetical protein [Arsenophonus nasoniae]
MEVINVNYKQHEVGAVSFDTSKGLGFFEYNSRFIKQGIELSPLKMPLATRIYSFPELDFNTFKGLPGLIADSLPDDFGNAVLNAWVATMGKSPDTITPLHHYSDYNIPVKEGWARWNTCQQLGSKVSMPHNRLRSVLWLLLLKKFLIQDKNLPLSYIKMVRKIAKQ